MTKLLLAVLMATLSGWITVLEDGSRERSEQEDSNLRIQ